MTNRVRTREYSGAPFGRPTDRLARGAASLLKATPTLLGQDSVTAADMQQGLAVYCFYASGTFANGTAVKADFPHKTYLGISPAPETYASCLDVEPGDAVPGDAPGFIRESTHPDTQLPAIYTSAGDLQAVIDACSAAGIARSRYLLFSAHWIGEHICSPGSCGYPASDATQYASNASFDSDIFYSYVFTKPAPPPPALPGIPGSLKGSLAALYSLNMSWAAVPAPKAGGVAGEYEWQVELQKSATSWELIRSGTTDTTSASAPGLEGGKALRWRVSGGNWSDWTQISTP